MKYKIVFTKIAEESISKVKKSDVYSYKKIEKSCRNILKRVLDTQNH
jgi:hypothetical protein